MRLPWLYSGVNVLLIYESSLNSGSLFSIELKMFVHSVSVGLLLEFSKEAAARLTSEIRLLKIYVSMDDVIETFTSISDIFSLLILFCS